MEQIWRRTQAIVLLPEVVILELKESFISTTSYTFAPCVGSFTSPGIDTR